MPWWGLLFGIIVVAWSSAQLWRAFTIKSVRAKGYDYPRSVAPTTFWLLVGFYFIADVLFGGILLLITVRGIGLI